MPDLYRPTLIALVLVLGVCDANKFSRVEKQNQELQSEIRKNQAAVDLDMQAKCARDSNCVSTNSGAIATKTFHWATKTTTTNPSINALLWWTIAPERIQEDGMDNRC
jgi:hypothetical protein